MTYTANKNRLKSVALDLTIEEWKSSLYPNTKYLGQILTLCV